MVVINPWPFIIHNLHKNFRRTRGTTRRAQYPLFVFFSFFSVTLQSIWGLGRLILEDPRSHTNRPCIRQNSSERVISSSQRPLPVRRTTDTIDELPLPPAGFETAIQAIEGPQTYILDHAATWDRLVNPTYPTFFQLTWPQSRDQKAYVIVLWKQLLIKMDNVFISLYY